MDRELALSNINEWVDDYVEDHGVKKSYIAEQIGMGRTTFYTKLRGESDFDIFEALAMAQLFNCSVDDLLSTPRIVA